MRQERGQLDAERRNVEGAITEGAAGMVERLQGIEAQLGEVDQLIADARRDLAALDSARHILKRDLVHVAAFNLSLVMRALLGVGTPRELRGRFQLALKAFTAALERVVGQIYRLLAYLTRLAPAVRSTRSVTGGAFSTGC